MLSGAQQQAGVGKEDSNFAKIVNLYNKADGEFGDLSETKDMLADLSPDMAQQITPDQADMLAETLLQKYSQDNLPNEKKKTKAKKAISKPIPESAPAPPPQPIPQAVLKV